MPESGIPEPEGNLFCEECGARVAARSRFCDQCGSAMMDDNSDAAAPPKRNEPAQKKLSEPGEAEKVSAVSPSTEHKS